MTRDKIICVANSAFVAYWAFGLLAVALIFITPDAVMGREALITARYDLPLILLPGIVAVLVLLPLSFLVARLWFRWSSRRSRWFNTGALVLLGGSVAASTLHAFA